MNNVASALILLAARRCCAALSGRAQAASPCRAGVGAPLQPPQALSQKPHPLPPLSTPVQGLVVIGPALHFWYGSLGSIVKATGNTGAIMRLSLDQLCFAPVFISRECGACLPDPAAWACDL